MFLLSLTPLHCPFPSSLLEAAHSPTPHFGGKKQQENPGKEVLEEAPLLRGSCLSAMQTGTLLLPTSRAFQVPGDSDSTCFIQTVQPCSFHSEVMNLPAVIRVGKRTSEICALQTYSTFTVFQRFRDHRSAYRGGLLITYP